MANGSARAAIRVNTHRPAATPNRVAMDPLVGRCVAVLAVVVVLVTHAHPVASKPAQECPRGFTKFSKSCVKMVAPAANDRLTYETASQLCRNTHDGHLVLARTASARKVASQVCADDARCIVDAKCTRIVVPKRGLFGSEVIKVSCEWSSGHAMAPEFWATPPSADAVLGKGVHGCVCVRGGRVHMVPACLLACPHAVFTAHTSRRVRVPPQRALVPLPVRQPRRHAAARPVLDHIGCACPPC